MIFGAFTEKSDFKGGSSRKTDIEDIEGGLPKKGVCRFKDEGGGLGKKEGAVVFEGGGGDWYPDAHYV